MVRFGILNGYYRRCAEQPQHKISAPNNQLMTLFILNLLYGTRY